MAKSPAKAKSPKPPVVKIRDRITELRRVKASDLIDNPRNWRSHPVEQLAALDAVLKEIGFAGAELAIETPEGLMLIDGHARKKLAGDEVIPVLVTDLTEAEANLILATFDPIGAMAEADAERLQALLDVVSTTDQDLADMLTKLAEDNGVAVPAAEITEDEIPEPPAVPITKPGDLWLLGVYYECECGEQHDLQELPDRVPGQPLQPEVLQRRMPEPSTEGRKSKVQANRKGRGDRSSMASKPGKKTDRPGILHQRPGAGSGSCSAEPTATEAVLSESQASRADGSLSKTPGGTDQGVRGLPAVRDDGEADNRPCHSDELGRPAHAGECSTALRRMQLEKEAEHHPVCRNCGKQLGVEHRKSTHRLYCGDSTKAEDVARLMDGAKANVCFTSPPYASQRKYDESSGFKPIHPDKYVEWWDAVQANVAKHLAADGSMFVNIKEHCEDGQRSLYVKELAIAHVRQWGWCLIDEFCWTRLGPPGSWPNRFKNGFEPIFHFSRQVKIRFRPDAVSHASSDIPVSSSKAGVNTAFTNGEHWNLSAKTEKGKARPGNVVVASGVEPHTGHAAAFPIALPTFFIRAFSDEADAIYEPFAGSGTTMIAAEQLKRRCFGMEISPAYCDVICQRFENLTGLKATLAPVA